MTQPTNAVQPPAPKEIRIAVVPQAADYAEAMQWLARPQRQQQITAAMLWAMLLLAAGILGQTGAARYGLCVAGIMFLVMGVKGGSEARRRLCEHWQTTPMMDQPCVIMLDREGFVEESLRGRIFMRWTACSHLVEAPTILIVMRGPGPGLLLPKRVFASEQELAQCRALLLDVLGRTTQEPPKAFPVVPIASGKGGPS